MFWYERVKCQRTCCYLVSNSGGGNSGDGDRRRRRSNTYLLHGAESFLRS